MQTDRTHLGSHRNSDAVNEDPQAGLISAENRVMNRSGVSVRPHNLIEDHVFDISDRLTASDVEFCGCEKCLTDVMAFALSQLEPAYVSSDQGRAITQARRESDGVHATITARVTEAIAAVKAHPHH
jgi:hypothetical protein